MGGTSDSLQPHPEREVSPVRQNLRISPEAGGEEETESKKLSFSCFFFLNLHSQEIPKLIGAQQAKRTAKHLVIATVREDLRREHVIDLAGFSLDP